MVKHGIKLRVWVGWFIPNDHVGPKCNHMSPFKRRADFILRQKHKREHNTHTRGEGNAEAETGVIQPPSGNASSYQRLGKAKNKFSPSSSVGSVTLLAL